MITERSQRAPRARGRQYRTPSGMLTFLTRPRARGALWLRSVIIFFHARCSLAPEASPDMIGYGIVGKIRFPFVASPRRGVFGQAGKIWFLFTVPPERAVFGQAGKVRFPFVAPPKRAASGKAGKVRFLFTVPPERTAFGIVGKMRFPALASLLLQKTAAFGKAEKMRFLHCIISGKLYYL